LRDDTAHRFLKRQGLRYQILTRVPFARPERGTASHIRIPVIYSASLLIKLLVILHRP
jgi:hypothetical protein